MGSRRDASALEYCVNQIKTKQKKVCDTSYEKNYIAVTQAIEDVLEDRAHIKEIKTKLKEIKKTRGHTKDFEIAESDFNLTEDLAWQKKRCLETSLYITEIENLFQNVQTDFEERALYLTERKPVFESVYRDEEVESSSRMHRECAYDIKKAWTWIADLTLCMNTHVKNAAEYNQYHHDIRHLDEDMETYILWLNSETIRKPVATKDPEVMIKHFRFMTTRLLDYQGRVDRLRETAQKIFPIYFRKELPNRPLTARSLIDYRHQEISLERNESCTVLDISDSEKWKIRTNGGSEGDVPAIVLVIPPPDPRSFVQAEKLREQLVIHWDTSLKRLRLQLIQFMTVVAKETQQREFQGLSTNQKSEFLKLANDSIQLLRTKGEDADYTDFKTKMTGIRKMLTQVKPGTKILKNGNVQKWQGTNQVFRQYTDVLAYIKSYKGDLARKIEGENFIVRDVQSPPTYTSKAYFESAFPMVDIDTNSKETKITRVKSELYIHERHKPKKPVPPPRRKRQVKQGVRPDEFSETTEYSEESKTFVIVGVIDPRSKEKLSVFQAISNGVLDQVNGTYNNPDTDYSISIPEAINKGYILIEFRDPLVNGVADDSFSLQNQMDYRIFGISGVIDPRTGELISVHEAIATGLIDLKRGIFRNPITGEEMSLLDAIKAGYLIADPSYFTDEDEKGTFTSVEMMDLKYVITSVIDPNTGEELSLKRAIKDGIIDPVNGLYRNPVTGETMTIEEAMKLGLIKGRLFDPSKDKEDENTLSVQQLQIRKQRFIPSGLDVSISNGDSADGLVKQKDPNEVLFTKVKEQVDTNVKCIKDPRTSEVISIEDAFNRGIINFAKAEFDTLDGEIMPIEEATAKGLIEPSVLQKILKTYQESSVGQLIDSGKFDPETGLVVDTATGHTLSLQAAVSQNIIDPNTTFFYDVPSQRIMSLSTAIGSGRCNLETGKIVKSATGEELSVSEAIGTSQILAHINPLDVAEHAETLCVLRKVMDTKMKGIKIPSSKELLSVEEAVSSGILNIPLVAYADESQEINPLQTAIKGEKIEPECGMALYVAFQRLSLEDAIKSKTLDPKKGKYIDPNTGEAMAINKSQEKGLWNPNYVYFVDNETKGVTSLGAFMDRGKFDAASGKVISDKTGKSMTIEQAIADGLINPVVDPEKFVDITTTLKDLIDSGKVNPRSTTFVAPNDLKMSLRDGLANGLLTMGSKVKLDPETGNVILMSDEDIVKSLVDVKENSDWLAEVEKLLGSQGRPSERLAKLKQQTSNTKKIKENLKEKEPALRATVRQAEELIENNKGKQQSDGAQQYKKLRYNTSDLKVRLDSATSEVDNRTDKMDSMCDNLEDFYGQLETLDQWLDTAIEKTQDLQSNNSSIEDQYNAFKDFYEEVKQKEEDIHQTSKAADNFSDNAQTFERELEVYRKSLPFMPTIDEETEAGILDDEIESIEAKYKDVSNECAKHMDRLSSIMKNKKTFDDANERLNSLYPKLNNQLKSINDKSFGKDTTKDSKDLKDLKQLKADVIGQERKLKDLIAAGERLTNGLVEAGLRKEAANVKNIVDDHKNKHTDLLNGITSKEEKLDAAVAEQQNVMGRLDGILDVVDNAEKLLKSKQPVSLNKDKLAQQLQEQRLLNADIGSNKALVDRLSRETHDMKGADDKLTDLGERLDVLERLADNRTQELEEISSGINDFDQKLSEVDSWLSDSIKTLKTKPKGGNNLSKAKVEALYEEKKEKEGSIERMRKACDDLMNDDRVCDHYAVKESLGEVETKWNDLTEYLVQQVSLEALSKIDGMLKYLDKAENEINTAEPISMDPETLEVQLRDHTAFNDDLIQKKNAVKDIINKCNKMLRETTNSQTDEIKSRLDGIQTQADIVCQLSSERLHQLESASPLAAHYSDTQAEVTAWLDEMEAELKAQGKPGESLEQIRKQYDHLKSTQQIIQDHKPFIDDLNSTGLELMDLCGDEDGNDIQTKLIDSNQKYEALKNQARNKARQLTDAKKKFTQEVTDSLDHLVEELAQLNEAVVNSDPIPAAPEKLRNEIDEVKAVVEDLERHKPDIEKAKDICKNLQAHGIEDPAEAEDVQAKLSEINKLYNQVQNGAKARDGKLNKALAYSDKLFDISSDVMASLRDLKDNMYSQEPPGVDPSSVKEQQSELEGLMNELDKARELMLDCRRIGDELCDICGEPGKIEVKKQIEDLVNLADDVADLVKDRREELSKALEHSSKYEELLDNVNVINSWLPLSEHKLAGMRPPSSDPQALKDQMDELKMFKSNVHPHITDMQQLNQQVAALKEMSPMASEVLMKPVEIVNDKWNDLIKGIADREGALNDMQVQVGKLDHAMDDVVAAVNQVQKDLDKLDNLNGDPKCLETKLRKLQLQQSDINNQDKTSRKINKAVDDLLANSSGDDSALIKKRSQMNEKIRAAQANAHDKENKLQQNLRQVKRYLGDVDDLLQWVNEFRMELKLNQPFGALPDTSDSQYEKFLKKCEEMDGREKTVQSLLQTGQDIIDSSPSEDTAQISDRMKKLRDRWNETRDRARKRKEKMEEHGKNVTEFHDTLKSFTDWLNNAEVMMRGMKYPSKLVDVITQQIDSHNNLKSDLEAQAELMSTLDKSGTYLKYFGRKQDTIYIKNLLVGIRLRWKKLLRRADERGRLLQQAYKEDKRFYDAWKELCDWLDSSATKLNKFMSGGKADKVMKQEMEELKKFEHQISVKHPTFYSTTRLGRNLKDRCTKNDPERDILQDMLDQLKNKWNSVRSVVSKSQNKLDEALLTSGRVSDALQSLIEWLHKAEATLEEDVPVLGDLDTVHMLNEQHKGIQQELLVREPTVETMRSTGNVPKSQKEELGKLWERVNYLSDVRENKLKDAMRLAEEFQDVVTVMREFLPQAESELKFRAFPEDELAIIQLIERHEKFQEDLRDHQDTVDKIKTLAEEILQGCHPNAVRFVKYYLTITQTRWDQLLQRAKSRAERLQEALRSIQGNAALLEELLSWLTDAQALLATKERDPIPQDLKVVETLLKEHLEFHDEVTTRNADAERLTKLVSMETKMSPGKNFGSNMRLNEVDAYNPRVTALQNRWRIVWRMSVDRKKKLQDAYDTLLELESFKNFDFDVWRVRYRKWIQAKKFRISDFFRRQDKDCDGALSREEFVQGMLQSKFPTNKTELNAVFDIFEKQVLRKPRMVYKEFIDALKADKRGRKSSVTTNKSDGELIHDEIEREVSGCQCRDQFKAVYLDEGKYRFGEKQRTYLVRFLNSTVMVRVGGGWITLEEFLETNDPCRARGRLNTDLRDQLLLPDGTGDYRSSRRGSGTPLRSTSPFPTGASRKRQTDTGYASSNSSAGSSADSTLRRSRITSSMVNLSNANGLHKNPDFGSTGSLTGSLSRSKRLSTSSSSLTPNGNTRPKSKTPTPGSSPAGHPQRRSSTSAFGRSITPTPTTSPYTSRSRPTTPTAFSSRMTSTPTRPGSTTPTRGLTKTRQLPKTPRSANR